MTVTLRSATLADAPAIARFHVMVWRDTYRELAPPEAHAILDVARRERSWSASLAAPAPDRIVLVAESEGRLVGIGAAGAPTDAVFGGRGEIGSLYVDPALKRRGIGRALLSGLAAHLRGRGYGGAALALVEGNDRAAAFYEALGGRVVGDYLDPGPIWRSRNIVYAWDDLDALI